MTVVMRAAVAACVVLAVVGVPGRARADADLTHPAVSNLNGSLQQEPNSPLWDVLALSWTNPSTLTAPTFTGITVRRVSGGQGATSELAGDAVYSGKDTTFDSLRTNVPTDRDSTLWTYTVFADYSDHDPVPVSTGALDGDRIGFAPSPIFITYGQSVVFSGEITDSVYGRPITGAVLDLVATPSAKGAPVLLAAMTADVNGDFFYRGNPARDYYSYELVYAGDARHPAELLPAVGPVISPMVKVTSATKKPKHGKTFSLRVGIGPHDAGQAVALQRQSGGRWKNVATGKTDRTGAVAFKVKEKTRGSYNYRAEAVANDLHVDGTSRKLTVKVS